MPASGKILFVCLGNICRSPIAEGIFAHLVRERGLEGHYLADSAGTGNWHIGQPPDPRAIAVSGKRGVELPSLCRQVAKSDFEDFDLILAMDRNNRKELEDLCPAPLRRKIRLLREFDPATEAASAGARSTRAGSALDVPDPYYGGPYEFDTVYEMLNRCCSLLLDTLVIRETGMPAHGDATAP
ncbi:MAG: low molecular weight protein-tyrosine-phosphatase [Fibrobacteria bacterium]